MDRSRRKDGSGGVQRESLLSGIAEYSPHAPHTHRGSHGLAPEMLVAALKATYGVDIDRSDRTLRQSSEWETETLVDPASNFGHDALGIASLTQVQSRVRYPCPFRKRNPVRFNIRDHEPCARAPFGSMSDLRHHIILHHKHTQSRSPFQCPRCKLRFEDEEALEHHLILPKADMCEVNLEFLDDPEDGVTRDVQKMLAGRYDSPENWTWAEIWRLVFPGDPKVPTPDFQPVVELVEIEHVFDEGQEALKTALQEKLRLLLPSSIDAQYCTFLATQLDLVFETHRANMTRLCLSRCQIGGLEDSTRKPTRNSRRNTLLQSIQRSRLDTSAGSTRRHTRTLSIRHVGNQHAEQSFLSRKADRYSAYKPHDIPTPQQPAASPSNTNKSTNTNNSPRDSRDSGIGLPCDDCTLEQCRCNRRSSGSEHNRQSAKPETQSGTSLFQHSHHPKEQCPQPRLSVRTSGPDFPLVEDDAVGSGAVGGRFSPESFKQRVLRKMGG